MRNMTFYAVGISVVFVLAIASVRSKSFRCGNSRLKFGRKNELWKKQKLTYVINSGSHSNTISRSQVAREVARAFKSWSDVSNLSFTRVDDKNADIRISFHGSKPIVEDDLGFDISMNAHAGPPMHAYLHFNEKLKWTIDPGIF